KVFYICAPLATRLCCGRQFISIKSAALKKNKNIFRIDVAGKEKGFYICTRLSDKVLRKAIKKFIDILN
ncbi:hypothetical protein, partial [Winogradskyella ouciana]|uniref:hypothetical protein n=1 Tax=Winogradskyella ouciana TaxID=2608631 RepID=UPI001F34953D